MTPETVPARRKRGRPRKTPPAEPKVPGKRGRPTNSHPGSGFGARLRYWRQQCGLTLDEAAARITAAGWSIAGSALYRLETGGEPDWLRRLDAIAAAYECPSLLLITPLADEDHGGLDSPAPARKKRGAS